MCPALPEFEVNVAEAGDARMPAGPHTCSPPTPILPTCSCTCPYTDTGLSACVYTPMFPCTHASAAPHAPLHCTHTLRHTFISEQVSRVLCRLWLWPVPPLISPREGWFGCSLQSPVLLPLPLCCTQPGGPRAVTSSSRASVSSVCKLELMGSTLCLTGWHQLFPGDKA